MKAISNGRDSSEQFTDNGGYFDVVVRPMLQQGHEGELCGWLKEMSLIRTDFACSQVDCLGRNLTWSAARVVDKYNWACPECRRKQSIRDSSFFLNVKGDFKIHLQLILGWCQMFPYELAAKYLGIKEHIVKKIYDKCAKVADAYVSSHLEEFKLGGPGSVLIVDEFPSGYMTENVMDVTTSRKRNNNSHAILCIAEANAVPPRMWLHLIHSAPSMNGKTPGNKCGMVEEALKEIVQHALPGSYIVANNRARCCNYESIKELKQYAVMSVEYLQKFDVPGKNKLLGNLAFVMEIDLITHYLRTLHDIRKTIWQTGVEVCEDVQESTNAEGQQIISTYLWRQRFCSTPTHAFECMLNHITEIYRFT